MFGIGRVEDVKEDLDPNLEFEVFGEDCFGVDVDFLDLLLFGEVLFGVDILRWSGVGGRLVRWMWVWV